METVTLSSKGQLVIPSRVRVSANLRAGDTLTVDYLNGEIRLRPVASASITKLDDVAGCMARPRKKLLSESALTTAISARLKIEDAATKSVAR